MLTIDTQRHKEAAKHKQENKQRSTFLALIAIVTTFLITGFSFVFGSSPTYLPGSSEEAESARKTNAVQQVSRYLERGALFSPTISVPEDADYQVSLGLEAKVTPPKTATNAIADFIAEQERAEAAAAAAAAEAAAAEAAAAEEAAERALQEERQTPAQSQSSNSTSPTATQSVPASTSQEIAHSMVMSKGWGESEFSCLVRLWQRESNWNHLAQNPSSGAYGIPQSLPGNKMASHGSDWQTNPATQIAWGIDYISGRYGTPCGAWQHSENHNWY